MGKNIHPHIAPTTYHLPHFALESRIANPEPAIPSSQSPACISHHGSGRAALQPRRYKAFLIIPVSRAPRSPSADGLRGAQDQQRGEPRFRRG